MNTFHHYICHINKLSLSQFKIKITSLGTILYYPSFAVLLALEVLVSQNLSNAVVIKISQE
jgi:hypothetical protein